MIQSAAPVLRLLCSLPLAALSGAGFASQDSGAGPAGAPLVVLTSHSPALSEPVARGFSAAFPRLRLEIVTLEPGLVLERLRGAHDARLRGAPSLGGASVWWGGDGLLHAQAAAEGLLARTDPAWTRSLSIAQKDREGYWHGQFLEPFVVAHRRSASGVPSRIEDLAGPAYRGRLLLRLPTDSPAMKLFLAGIVAARAGEEGGVSRAFDWLAILDGNRADDYLVDSRQLLERVASSAGAPGSGDLTVWTASDIVRMRDAEGVAIDFTVVSNAPAYLECIAATADAPDASAAAAFVDYVGRDEWLASYVQAGRIPLPIDRIDPAAFPAWMKEASARTRLIDREIASERMPEWLGEWNRRFRVGASHAPTVDESGDGWSTIIDVVGTLGIGVVLLLLLRRERWRTSEPESGGSAPPPAP